MATRRLSASLRKSLGQAVTACERHVSQARTFLERRGITSQAARDFRLGVVPDETPIEYAQFKGRLVIPYLDRLGVANIRFRCVGLHDDCKAESHKKYLGFDNLSVPLYNTPALFRDEPYIAIVEGELDTVIMDGLCGVPAVGCGGSHLWKEHHPLLFRDYDTVFIVGDGDEAGRSMAKGIAHTIDNGVVVRMPDDEDVNSLYLKEGADGIRKRLGL